MCIYVLKWFFNCSFIHLFVYFSLIDYLSVPFVFYFIIVFYLLTCLFIYCSYLVCVYLLNTCLSIVFCVNCFVRFYSVFGLFLFILFVYYHYCFLLYCLYVCYVLLIFLNICFTLLVGDPSLITSTSRILAIVVGIAMGRWISLPVHTKLKRSSSCISPWAKILIKHTHTHDYVSNQITTGTIWILIRFANIYIQPMRLEQ